MTFNALGALWFGQYVKNVAMSQGLVPAAYVASLNIGKGYIANAIGDAAEHFALEYGIG